MTGTEEDRARRRERQRLARVGFAVLGLVMLGHAALETARDALFLERIDPARLPLAYLGIAVGAVLLGRASVVAARRIGAHRTLPATLAAGAVLTAGFLFGPASPVELGLLYVWVGVFASAAVIQLWSRLAHLFDVGEAKLAFGFVGAGALIGASAGAGLSAIVLELGAEPAHLVGIGAAAFLLAGVVAMGLGVRGEPTREREPQAVASTRAERRYAVRLGLAIGGAAALFTWVDLAFKTAVASAVDPSTLGVFFARTYTALNVASVVVQLVVLPRLLRSVGAPRSVKILPAILLAGGVLLATTGHLVAAAGLLVAQGTLRHGLFKTSCEILAMPLREGVRARFKALGEVAAQRGGQALAAAVGLIAFGLGADAQGLGILVVAGAAAWILGMLGVGDAYLGLFRARLQTGGRASEIPELDLGALETLLEALSSEDEREVLGALDWFETYGKSHLVPALILFHPSSAVTLRALALFDAHPRPDAERVGRRRLDDPDPAVRAAALRLVARGEEGLERARTLARADPSPLVRAEALAILVARDELTRKDACEALSRLLESADEAGAIATARALHRLPPRDFGGLARILAEHPSPMVANALADALARAPHPTHANALVRLLGSRASRSRARSALVALGDEGETALDAGLADAELPVAVRRQIPRVLGDFAQDPRSAERVAGRLVRRLDVEPEGRIAEPTLRALARLRARLPDTPLDPGWVSRGARASLERSVAFLSAAEALARPSRSEGRALLVRLLREKSERALRDTFTWLHLARPESGLLDVHRALTRGNRARRASARELLETIEPVSTRRALEAFTIDGSPRDRIDGAVRWLTPGEIQTRSNALLERTGSNRAQAERRLLESLLGAVSATLRALAERELAETDPSAGREQVRHGV